VNSKPEYESIKVFIDPIPASIVANFIVGGDELPLFNVNNGSSDWFEPLHVV
jgi:hypothetical protein